MKSIIGLFEYTFTGVFVWLLFVVFVTMVGMDAGPDAKNYTALEVWQRWINELPSLPQEVQTSPILKEMASLTAGGVLLVVAFATGFLLDLAAPAAFAVVEISWARKWFLRERGNPERRAWLDDLIDKQGAIVKEEYQLMAHQDGTPGKPVVWLVHTYWRLALFLTSYALKNAKGGQLDDVNDRLKHWRVSQSISLSLVLLLGALTIWIFHTWDQRQAHEAIIIGIVLPAALFVLSYLSMRMTYFRLVVALQTAAFLSWTEHQTKPPPAGEAIAIAKVA